jgi:adenine-specific DNA-methyltransferase
LKPVTEKINKPRIQGGDNIAGKVEKKYQDLCLMLGDDQVERGLKSPSLTQGQTNDVFNLITEFFSRYFDKGDFLSKKRYGGKNHYIIPYNGEEVLLHWANHDQYYVKTDRHFKTYSFKAGDLQVSFKIKEAETESNNNKGEKKYFVLADERAIQVENSHAITIWFRYRTLSEAEKKKYGTRSVQDEFLKEVLEKVEEKNNGLKAVLLKKNGNESSLLEKHLRRYVNENTHDFFIHKNLRGFLNRELEFFIKNEVLDLEEMESMDEQHFKIYMTKAKTIRGICQKIIEFLAQIEEFQKKLFEKKKFVIRTDYCMTLDKVPEDFYIEIVSNENQVEEWKDLFKLEEVTKDLFSKTDGKTLDADFLKSHRSLVLDTKFFSQDFKDRLLACFKNLDEEIGGLIMKSENFQALDFLMEKFQEKVKCIYIDQPYNTGDDEFIYKDDYQHSSWLSMMWDRLLLARNVLCKDGLIFVSIDDHEQARLKILSSCKSSHLQNSKNVVYA